ncbi:MAG: DNA repair exonuclease [Hylemonella sp.]|nr:DNA repair exonuclease [Hylemonella sp.]
MRFIHTADLHIDSPLRGLSRYEGAPVERLRGATRHALQRLVDLAIEEQVAFVLIAGDLYDSDWQDFHTGLFVREQMVRLARQHIRVFIVQGNHDAQGVISRQVPWPDNVKVFSSRNAETVRIADLKIAIHGHSFADREVPEDLVPGYPEPVAGHFNIGMLHTSLTGAEGHDTYAPTTLTKLQTKGYDYWALGHVHERKVLSDSPPIVYPGNLQGRHAKETGAKGCQLVCVQAGKVGLSFVSLDVVRWHQLSIDVSALQRLEQLPALVTERMQAAAGEAIHALHAMRITLTGETVLAQAEAQQPGTLAAAVQAAAQDVIDAEVWTEKILLTLRSPVSREHLAQGADAMGELVRWVNVLRDDPAALREFCQPVLDSVLNNLPAEVRAALKRDGSADDVPQLDDAQSLRQLLGDAQATLLARLGAGEAQP